jgi:hypothetical protein
MNEIKIVFMKNEIITRQVNENKRLNVFLGKWRTTGDMYDVNGKPAGKIEAIDTYEWLPGNYAMIHYVSSSIGEEKIHGIEVIGYDPLRKAYFGPFFDDHGSAGWEEISVDGNTWTWHGENVMGVKYHRCIATFRDGNYIVARHERSNDGGNWQPWMDIALKKIS